MEISIPRHPKINKNTVTPHLVRRNAARYNYFLEFQMFTGETLMRLSVCTYKTHSVTGKWAITYFLPMPESREGLVVRTPPSPRKITSYIGFYRNKDLHPPTPPPPKKKKEIIIKSCTPPPPPPPPPDKCFDPFEP